MKRSKFYKKAWINVLIFWEWKRSFQRACIQMQQRKEAGKMKNYVWQKINNKKITKPKKGFLIYQESYI